MKAENRPQSEKIEKTFNEGSIREYLQEVAGEIQLLASAIRVQPENATDALNRLAEEIRLNEPLPGNSRLEKGRQFIEYCNDGSILNPKEPGLNGFGQFNVRHVREDLPPGEHQKIVVRIIDDATDERIIGWLKFYEERVQGHPTSLNPAAIGLNLVAAAVASIDLERFEPQSSVDFNSAADSLRFKSVALNSPRVEGIEGIENVQVKYFLHEFKYDGIRFKILYGSKEENGEDSEYFNYEPEDAAYYLVKFLKSLVPADYAFGGEAGEGIVYLNDDAADEEE